MSINRIYYGKNKVYSFLENGNSGGGESTECNCEQEYQNGYNQGYLEGLKNCQGGGSGDIVNPFSEIAWEDSDVNNALSGLITDDIIDIYNNFDVEGDSCSSLFRDNYNLIISPKFDMSNKVYADIMYYGCRNLLFVPDMATPKLEIAGDMFGQCYKLSKAPMLDMGNVRSMYRMFADSGIIFVPHYNTESCTDFNGTFYNCRYLKEIPQLNTQLATNVSEMFMGCVSLKSLPQFDFSNVDNIYNFFGWEDMALTEIGGFQGLKIPWDDDGGLYRCPNLTYNSVMNIIEGLATVDNATLKIHPNSLSLLSENDIQMAVSKGWIITA